MTGEMVTFGRLPPAVCRLPRQDPLLAALPRLPHDLPRAALAGRHRYAAPLRRLPPRRWLHLAENQVSTIGSMSLAVSFRPFIFNVYITARRALKVAVNDPWGYGRSLEWATSCPPPRHNFTSIPRIRSESPAFDLNHPEAGIPIGVGPAKDAPDADTFDAGSGKMR
jgi:hypothetical protein